MQMHLQGLCLLIVCSTPGGVLCLNGTPTWKCAKKSGHQERGEDVNLLTYLKEAPEQNDGQLQKDLQSHSPSADLAAWGNFCAEIADGQRLLVTTLMSLLDTGLKPDLCVLGLFVWDVNATNPNVPARSPKSETTARITCWCLYMISLCWLVTLISCVMSCPAFFSQHSKHI